MGIAMWCDDPFCKFHGFQWENMEPYELKDLQDLEASWNIYGSWVHVPWSVKLVCLTLPQVPSMVGENTMTIRNHIPRKVGMIIAAKDMDLWICSCFFYPSTNDSPYTPIMVFVCCHLRTPLLKFLGSVQIHEAATPPRGRVINHGNGKSSIHFIDDFPWKPPFT